MENKAVYVVLVFLYIFYRIAKYVLGFIFYFLSSLFCKKKEQALKKEKYQ